jgi:fructokinase
MSSSKPTLVSIGEVLWDRFPDGARFGGAPANLASHAASLGADAYLISCVGQDELGDEALKVLEENGIHLDYIQRSGESPTGTVEVSLDDSGKPTFDIKDHVAWDKMTWEKSLEAIARKADAVCFGTLAQRHQPSRETIRRFVQTVPDSSLRVLDINLRPPFTDGTVVRESLELANVLKLSSDEMPFLSDLLELTGPPEEIMQVMRDIFDLRMIAMTMGSEGAILQSASGVSHCRGIEVEQMADTVGAGDAFTATVVHDFLAGQSLDSVNEHACRVAAYVCSQTGGTPKLPDDLIHWEK